MVVGIGSDGGGDGGTSESIKRSVHYSDQQVAPTVAGFVSLPALPGKLTHGRQVPLTVIILPHFQVMGHYES